MKILIAIPTLKIGGAETFTINLYKYLVENHNLDVYFLNLNYENYSDDNPLEEDLKYDRKYFKISIPVFLKIELLSKYYRKFFKSVYISSLSKKVLKLIDEIKPDLIHSSLIDCDRIIAGLNLQIPTLVTNQGCYLIESINDRSYLLERFTHIVCVSHYAKKKMSNFYNRQNVSVIENAYEKKNKINGITRRELSIPEGAFVFTHVARGVREKGWIVAIKAFHQFKYYESSYLIAVGDGPGIIEAKDYVAENKIKNVIFTGFQTLPQKYMAISNVGILPSFAEYESLPLSLVESLHEGLPLIGTRNGGIPDIIENNKGNAGIVTSKINGIPDVNEITLAMNEIYEKYDFYKSNIKYNVERYSLRNCANKYVSVYSNIVNQ